MKNDAIQQKAFSGMIWKFAEKAGAQIMQLVIQIVLARVLLPEEYGIVGLLTVFITLSDVFILQGFTTALIQKKDPDSTDFSSVFFANIAMSVILYLILFVCAPYIALFYNEPQLTSIMRVLSLNVIIGAIPAVHNAVLSRNLDFKRSFVRNISNTFTQGAVGIPLALTGFGAWSMVIGKVSGTLVGSVALCLAVKWRPERKFSFSRLKSLFSFSSKVLGTNLLNTLFNNLNPLLIGHFYSPTDVGFYQRGQQFPQTIMASLDGSMTEVLYPTFSKYQNDIAALKSALRRSIKTSVYIVFPVLLGLLAVAEPLVLLLLTEKWLPCVPFLQLTCIICMFWPLSHRSHALNAIGKSNITFILSIIGKSITLALLFASIQFGIYAMVISSIISSLISFSITSFFMKKHILYSLREVLADILPPLLLSLCMAVPVFFMSYLPIPTILLLGAQVILGAVMYIGLSALFKLETFRYLLNIAKGFIKKK